MLADFIEFIVKNFFVVVIVIGFIASLLRKAKKNGPQRGGRMPDFGGGGAGGTARRREPQPFGERQSTAQPFGGRQSAEPQPAQRPSAASYGGEAARGDSGRSAFGQPSTSLASERESLDQTASAIRDRAMQKSLRNTRSENAAPASPAGRQPGFRMPEGDELRRAFILAEVLGPPRSRKPLRRP